MHNVCVSSDFVGSEKNLLITEAGEEWSDEIPKGYWVLSADDSHLMSYSVLCKINGVEIPVFIDDHHAKIWSGFCCPKWKEILGQKWRSRINSLVKKIREQKLDESYFRSVYIKQLSVCRSFQPIRTENGNFSAPKYDFFSTKTGRWIVKSGLNVLTLKKELRDSLILPEDGNSYFSSDFSSLEITFILQECGMKLQGDPYQEINRLLFSGSLDRQDCKVKTLSAVYNEKTTDPASKLIRNHFKIDELTKKIKSQIRNDKVKNKYGKCIKIDDLKDALNNYVQSSCVDVSCMGFYQFLRDNRQIVPYFTVHDAIYYESKEELPDYNFTCPITNYKFTIKTTRLK